MAVDAPSAIEQLTWHYEHPFAQAIEKDRAGIPIAAVTSNTLSWELLFAAGFFSVMLNPPLGPAPLADRFMEDGVFSSRIRSIFDGLASGAWPFLKLAVIPRTSEQEHKLYLYLREVARQGLGNSPPEIYLYNLLHTRSPEAEEYGLQRTRDLMKRLEYLSGRAIEAAAITRAVCESDQARQGVASLLHLRQGSEPRLSGAEAIPLIGAVYFMDRAEYAKLIADAVIEISQRPPVRGARLLIRGSPLHHTGLHRAIEAHRAVVVAEDDWWGSRAISQEIAVQGDIVGSIFEAYYRDTPSPRVFSRSVTEDWFLAAAATVDGVVFYLPPEDDVLGWDYPRLREAIEQRGIPGFLVRENAAEGLSFECHQNLEDFISRLSLRR